MTHKDALNLILSNMRGERTDAEAAKHDGYQLFKIENSFDGRMHVAVEAKCTGLDPVRYEIKSCKSNKEEEDEA